MVKQRTRSIQQKTRSLSGVSRACAVPHNWDSGSPLGLASVLRMVGIAQRTRLQFPRLSGRWHAASRRTRSQPGVDRLAEQRSEADRSHLVGVASMLCVGTTSFRLHFYVKVICFCWQRTKRGKEGKKKKRKGKQNKTLCSWQRPERMAGWLAAWRDSTQCRVSRSSRFVIW
jgi:hypothetical protein